MAKSDNDQTVNKEQTFFCLQIATLCFGHAEH